MALEASFWPANLGARAMVFVVMLWLQDGFEGFNVSTTWSWDRRRYIDGQTIGKKQWLYERRKTVQEHAMATCMHGFGAPYMMKAGPDLWACEDIGSTAPISSDAGPVIRS
jgi:hypothetical protein